jgi:flavin-dependent dehydrogenase
VIFDVVVVGGGPAGTACAMAVGRSRSVALVDDGREKVCGGLLNRQAQSQLQQLLPSGADVEALASAGVLRAPEEPALDLFDFDTGLFLRTHPGYLNIDRAAFDDWLRQRAIQLDNLTLLEKTRADAARLEDDLWCVRLRGDGSEIRGRALVLATGYTGLTQLVPGFRPGRVNSYVALQIEVPSGNCRNLIVVVSKQATDYFAWVIPKQGVAHIGVAVPKGEQQAATEFIEGLASTCCGQKASGEPRRGCWLAVPESQTELRPDLLPRAFTVGEAAGFVSPASGDGISFALQSGRELGAFLAEAVLPFGVDSYRLAIRQLEARLRPVRRRIDKALVKANIMSSPPLRRVGGQLLQWGVGRIFGRRVGVAGCESRVVASRIQNPEALISPISGDDR